MNYYTFIFQILKFLPGNKLMYFNPVLLDNYNFITVPIIKIKVGTIV